MWSLHLGFLRYPAIPVTREEDDPGVSTGHQVRPADVPLYVNGEMLLDIGAQDVSIVKSQQCKHTTDRHAKRFQHKHTYLGRKPSPAVVDAWALCKFKFAEAVSYTLFMAYPT